MQNIARSPQDIGHALREARKAKGLTQSQLAALSGIWQETISKIENGLGGTKLETIFDLLAALELELIVADRSRGSERDFEDIF